MNQKQGRGKRGFGCIYLRGRTWWITYYHKGKKFCESAGSKKETVATAMLKKRIGEIQAGRFTGLAEKKLTVEQLADNLITHLTAKGAKAVKSYESHLKPIRDAFGHFLVVELTTTRIEQFISDRHEAGKANATINVAAKAYIWACTPCASSPSRKAMLTPRAATCAKAKSIKITPRARTCKPK